RVNLVGPLCGPCFVTNLPRTERVDRLFLITGATMPDTYSCPHCQIQLRLTPEMVGQTLRCPGCKATFTAGASAPPPIRHQEVVTERKAPEPPPQGPPAYPPPRQRRFVREDEQEMDWGEEPREKLAGEDIEAWRSVHSGLSLHLLAHYLYLGGVGLMF